MYYIALSSKKTPRCTKIVLSILEHAHNTSPRLHHSGTDLVCGQSESVGARVAELIGVGVRRVALDIGVVCRRASGSV
jgi:hypothetical protein